VENESDRTWRTVQEEEFFFDIDAQVLAECNLYQRTISPWRQWGQRLLIQKMILVIQCPQSQNLRDAAGADVVVDTVVAHVAEADADVAALRNTRKDQAVLAVVGVGASAAVVAHKANLAAECRMYIHHWEGVEAVHWTHLDTTELSVVVCGTVHY
jgi:hypothetical protein